MRSIPHRLLRTRANREARFLWHCGFDASDPDIIDIAMRPGSVALLDRWQRRFA